MNAYYLQFKVFGEVAEMVMLNEPTQRLLVDISSEPSCEFTQMRPANLVTLTITDEELIGRFLREVSVGDATAVSGTFHQSGYVPYKTTYIDTILLVADFEKLDKDVFVREYEPRATERQTAITLH